jgi:hypothetical protein
MAAEIKRDSPISCVSAEFPAVPPSLAEFEQRLQHREELENRRIQSQRIEYPV